MAAFSDERAAKSNGRLVCNGLANIDGYEVSVLVLELARTSNCLTLSYKRFGTVHARAGHAAPQTLPARKGLLGYRDVLWYDVRWTNRAAHAKPLVIDGAAMHRQECGSIQRFASRVSAAP
jgi:hypothetical protein